MLELDGQIRGRFQHLEVQKGILLPERWVKDDCARGNWLGRLEMATETMLVEATIHVLSRLLWLKSTRSVAWSSNDDMMGVLKLGLETIGA